jgi:hypothetical protein
MTSDVMRRTLDHPEQVQARAADHHDAGLRAFRGQVVANGVQEFG